MKDYLLKRLILLVLLIWRTAGSSQTCGNVFKDEITCLELTLDEQSICDQSNKKQNSVIPTELSIDSNSTILGKTSHLQATVNTSLEPMYYFFCYTRLFSMLPIPFSFDIGCQYNVSIAEVNHTWEFAGKTTIYAFTYDGNSSYGCDYKETIIGTENYNLEVKVRLYQENHNKNKDFSVGNITFRVRTKYNPRASPRHYLQSGTGDEGASQNGSHSYSGSSEESGSSDGKTSNKTTMFEYHFYFPNNSMTYQGNESNFSLEQYYPKETNCSVFIEVIRNESTKGSSKLSIGNATQSFTVLEPVRDLNLNFVNGKMYVGETIYVLVSAQGSFPIKVEWKLALLTNNTQQIMFCHSNDTVLDDKTNNFQFTCFFNVSGEYQFNASYKNDVSQEYKTHNFEIKQPPPVSVVATSTTAIAILIVFLVIVVICIVLIASYIPYRRYKHKTTETANFSFIDLQKPSRWERFKFQVEKFKDRIAKKRGRVGLVNYRDRYGEETLDSFYGSLNPFAAHESL